MKVECQICKSKFKTTAEATVHQVATGHLGYKWVKSGFLDYLAD